MKSHIWIEINISSYAISGILSQLNLNSNVLSNNLNKSDFDKCYLVTYFFGKMIFAETQYKTYNAEFFTIIEAFKTWRDYIKGCKHKVFILINDNNLH